MGLAEGLSPGIVFAQMWLFTTQGFYSAVAHREDPDKIIVRTRAGEDLEALADQIPDLEISEDPTADYRYRATVARDEWRRALDAFGRDLDYDNFKNTVAARQGPDRAHSYFDVWEAMRRLQDG